ncbi:MAG TPA: toll/interleukin-1 receptor domain-containing protein, partial [Burkholderiales bacterium]|nr:toll/interleukin-1 receptor domain-containing protein [Burkholderiales bacterium]
MASVFLSYDRDDTERARPIAEALESAGHEVWWDLHVRGGAQFSKVIEDALNASQVVVVLWSTHSVNSTWVRDEAAAGRDSGRLVPVTLDGTKAPLGFRQFQTIDLSVRKGRSKSAELKNLLADIQAVANAPNAAPMSPERPISATRVFRLDWRIAAAVVAVVGIIVALAIWRSWAGREQVPSVVVEAAANDRYSQALALDLVVKLGSLQSVHSAPMRLINRPDSSGKRPDLILEVGRLADPSAVTANVALMTARDRGILWSKEFEQPSRNLADLKQQIAYSAARVLGCATDGLRAPEKPLRQEPLQLYLNACGQLSEVTNEPPAVIPGLLQVIRQAPRFEAAWKLLLLTEAGMVDPARQEGDVNPALRRTLADHIAAARKLDQQMAEATIAEIALLPLTDFVKRMQLID